jgi:hypothetical protein
MSETILMESLPGFMILRAIPSNYGNQKNSYK